MTSEFDIHCSIASLLHANRHRGLWFSHFPAGEKRDPIIGAKLKRMGLKKGVADYMLFIKTEQGSRLCFLEVKAEAGRQSPEQKEFQLVCEFFGFPYAIVRSVTEADRILRSWGAFRRTEARAA